MTLLQDFINWCNAERDSLLRGNQLMQNGTLRFHRGTDGVIQDVTAAEIKDNNRKIAELDDLLARHNSGG